MKAHISGLVLFVFSFGAVACAPGANAPARHIVPMISVSEEQDEWLHEHCTPKLVFTAGSREAGDPLIRASSANFAEIIYVDRAFHAVAFACRTRPEWVGAETWVPLEAIAQRSSGVTARE